MVRRCCVQNCGTVPKDKLTFFKVPADDGEREKWARILKSDMKPTSYVCEKHFHQNDINTGTVTRDTEGYIMYVWENKVKRLIKGSIPCAHSDSSCSKKLKTNVDNNVNLEEEFPDTTMDVDISACNVNAQPDEEIVDNDHQINDATELEFNLFNDLVKNKDNLKVPRNGWGLLYCEEGENFVATFVKTVSTSPNRRSVATMYTKQVTVNKKSEVNLKFLHKEIELNDAIPTNVKEFENLLRFLDGKQVCSGGPSVQFYKTIHPECAFRDTATWRHKKCPVILDDALVCSHCLSLHKLLPQNLVIQRRSRKRVRIPASPTTRNKIQKTRKEGRMLKQRLYRKEQQLDEALTDLNDVQDRLRDMELTSFADMLKASSEKIPKNQVTLIEECFAAGRVQSSHGRRYSHEWLLLCLLIYIRSSATYNMLRKNEILPLPSKSTVIKYLQASKTNCGFDDDFFLMFEKELETYPVISRNGILTFDEISVRKSIEVDMKTMTFSGLQDFGKDMEDRKGTTLDDQANHALVFMFSSLCHNFHQPVGMFGSKGTTPSNVLAILVLQAIIKIEQAGGRVRGIACDGATTNRSMWTSLGISGKINDLKFFFDSPSDESRIVYVMSDVPHLIKNIRNRLHDKRILKIQGKAIKWEYYEALYFKDSESDLRVCPKLTCHHIKVVNTMKMRVSLATQIFSNSVAKGIQFYQKVELRQNPEKKLFEGCQPTVDFTFRINDTFDALNRSFPKEGIKVDSPDLQVMEDSIKWLDEWEKSVYFENEFLTASTGEGLRVTLHSTLNLTKDLLSQNNFKYVLTAKMNQDCLEQFFGIIRQAGGQNDHPTFGSFMQLYNLLSVYKILKPPKHGNCTVREKAEERREITFQDFKEIFKHDSNSYKKTHLAKLKEKIDHLIETSDWECDEVIESDFSMGEVRDCIIYYITGYVCRKFLKKEKCATCQEAFASSYQNVIAGRVEADLVSLKSRGGLIHPNFHLFQLFQKIENYFQRNLNSDNIYHKVISELSESAEPLTFPCAEHMDSVVPELIHYYLLVRMRQFSKLTNRETKKKSRNQSKMSKLLDN